MPFPVFVDDHAVERFIERCFPPSSNIALRRLHAVRCRAEFVEDIADEGQELWRGYEVGSVAEVLMVVKDETVKTVLWPGSRRPVARRR